MATSPDCFAQVSASSAAATVGNPARATTAKHANNQYADERICIACGLRTLTGGAGIADRFPGRSSDPQLGSQLKWFISEIGRSVSGLGHSRHFDRPSLTSGLPPETDIL